MATNFQFKLLGTAVLAVVFSILAHAQEPVEPLPRYLTAAEQSLLSRTPLVARGGGETPSMPLRTPAEYDPMEAIIIAYEGPGGWLDILEQMTAQITTLGNADVYVMANTNGEVNTIENQMMAAGADMNRVHVLVINTDSIWMRDYGPRYVYEGQCRAIVDHTYNRPRANDNQMPTFFAQNKNHRRYELPLVHGGGNYHLHTTGEAHTTRLINNENPGLSQAEIADLWRRYQLVETDFYQEFPIFIDSTQHIDMWMIPISDDAVIISDWPFDQGSTQDQICDSTAATLTSQGYTVHRVPARSVGGTHYTYTNAVICNDIVLVPSYTQGQVTQHNQPALDVWEQALPGKTIIPINCQAIVTAAGVMHCIVMHLPAAPGGLHPTVHLRNEIGGQMYASGTQVTLDYLVDDDVGVEEVDILLSLNGGQDYSPLQTGVSPTGMTQVQLPLETTFAGRLRVLARDADGRTGFHNHALDFIINGPRACPVDCFPDNGNGQFGDGTVDMNDLLALASHWLEGFGPYDVAPHLGNQVYGDATVDIRDAIAVVNGFGACP